MKTFSNKILLLMLAGVVSFTACKDDEEDPTSPSSMAISSIVTSDGTDLFGATNATSVGTDQDVTITFSQAVDVNSIDAVGIYNGSTEVPSAVSASGSTITIEPNENLFGGTLYTVKVEGVKSTSGVTVSPTNVDFTTAGIGLGTAPASTDQIMYVQFNENYDDLTGNTSMSFSQNGWTTDRFGNANGALWLDGATAQGNGDIVEYDGEFITPSLTLSVWFKVDPADFPGSRPVFGVAAEKGYFLEVGGNIDWMKFTSSHIVSPDPMNHYFGASNTDPNGDGNVGGITTQDYTGSINELTTGANDGWAHFVMSYDATTSLKTIWINGTLAMQQDLNLEPGEWQMTDLALKDQQDGTGDPISGIEAKLAFGFFASRNNGPFDDWNNYSLSQNTFKGAMDDFRLWNVALTQQQVDLLYDAEKVQ